MAIEETISIEVTGLGELTAAAGAADDAAAAFERLEGILGKGLDVGAAGGGADKLAASYEAALGKIQAQVDALDKSLADMGKSAAGGDAGAASLGKLDDALKGATEQADALADAGAKVDDSLKGLGDTAAGGAASVGKLDDSLKGASESAAGLKDTSAGAADGIKGIGAGADISAAQMAEFNKVMADSAAMQAETSKVSADASLAMARSSKVQADAKTSLATTSVEQDAAMAQSAKVTQAAHEDAAASAESSAGKYHMAMLGAAAGLAYGVDLAAKLQTGVTRLYTSAGESQANLGTISSGVLGMAPQTGQSQANLLSGLYYAESAGFHGKNALAVERSAAEGATAEGASASTVSNALTTLLNDYYGGPQKNAKTQQDQATSGMNAIMAAVGSGKMTLQDLSSAMPTLLPTAKSAGLSLPQVLGAEATMTGQGSSAQASAQEIRHTITSIEKPTSVQAAEQQMLGINPNQLSKDLGKQGLTGTIAEVDSAIQKHMGPGGMVMLNTLNQSKLAAQSANEEISAMPPAIQGVAKAYMAGTVSAKAFNQEIFSGPESARDKALLSQFQTTASNALGFSAIVKSGLGDKQTVTAALNEALGGQVGSQVALQVGGSHLKTFGENVKTVGEAAQQSGENIRGWGDVTKTLGFQLKSSEQAALSVLTEAGQVALPGITDALKVMSGAGGFLASHSALTRDLMIGGGALALPAILSKVLSPLATGLSSVGKVAETLHIPGLDKLAGIGQGTGMDTAATGLSGAAGSLEGAAGALEGAAASLKGAPVAEGVGGAEGAARTGEGEAAGAGAAAAGAGAEGAEVAEGAGAGGLLTKLIGSGGVMAGLRAAGGTVALGLTVGEIARGVGDQIAPKGSTAGDYNKMFQQQAAQGGPASQLHPYTMGGFEGWLTQHAGEQTGNVINRGLSQASQMVTTPFDAMARATHMPAPVTTGRAAALGDYGGAPQPAAPSFAAAPSGIDQIGAGAHPSPVKITVDTSAIDAAKAKVQSDIVGLGGHPSPVKLPAPDISAIAGAKSQVQADIAGMGGHPAPIRLPAPDLSALAAAKGTAAADGAAVGAGFATGIASETGAAAAAGASLASAAEAAMKVHLQISSPSKVAEKIGADLDAGFTQGITGNTDSVKAASAEIGSASIASLLQGLAGGQTNVQNAIQAVMGAAANPDAVTSIQQTIQTLIGDVPAKDTGLVTYLTGQQAKLTALANKQGAVEAQISNAQQVATSAISGAGITSAVGYEPALATSNGPAAAQSILTGMQQQLGDTQAFAGSLAQLQKEGLNATSESQLAQAGTTAGLPLAEGLQQGGKGAVTQLNQIEAQIIKASQSIGSTGGTAMYKASQQVMAGLDAPLKAELTSLDKDMSKIANSIIATVQKKLGTGTTAASTAASGSTAAATTTAATSAGAATSAASTAGLGAAGTAAAGGLSKAGAAGSAAASGLASVASAAGGAASGLGKVASALAPLLAAASPSAAPGGGHAQPSGGGAAYGGSAGGGSGPVNVTHNHYVTVQGSVLSNQDLFSAMQKATLATGGNNWQVGIIPPGRHN